MPLVDLFPYSKNQWREACCFIHLFIESHSCITSPRRFKVFTDLRIRGANYSTMMYFWQTISVSC